FHRVEVKRRRLLHRRIFNRCFGELGDILLNHNKTPKFASEEVIDVARSPVIKRLAANRRRPFKRILTNVDQGWHVPGGFFARPTPGLLEKHELKVVEANRPQMRATEVENFMPRGWSLAFKQVHLVVTVEVILVAPVAEFYAI